MALTLVEAEKLSQDVLLKGVIKTIITESELLRILPFIDIVGNGLTYDQENTLPGAEFHEVNGVWVESTPTFKKQTATLCILGGDADVDEFLRKTRSNQQNLKAIVTDLKSKAIARTFEDYAIYGDVASNPLGFNGMHNLVETTDLTGVAMQVHAGSSTTPAGGSIRKLKQLIRAVRPGGPDYLLMSRTTRDNLSDYAERNESPLRIEKDAFGKPITYFGSVPIVCSDFILQTEAIASSIYSAKTGGTATSIFAMKVGEKLLAGCQNGGIDVKDLGDLETKDATRTRIKWYVSMALFNTLALARYDGITDAAWGA